MNKLRNITEDMSVFEKRLITYFNFLYKKEGRGNLTIIVRELDKIFQLGIDEFYSQEERKRVPEELISISQECKDTAEKACYLVFAYKLNEINNYGLNIEPIYLDNTLIIDQVFEPIPNKMLDIMSEKHRQQAIDNERKMTPEKEILNKFNIQLYPCHFKWNKINAALRNN